MNEKRRRHLDFRAVNLQKSQLRLVITWFQCRFDLGVKYDFLLVLRSQFFEYLREICTTMRRSTWKRLVQIIIIFSAETPDYY